MTTLAQAAVAVLTVAEPGDKTRLTKGFSADWRSGRIAEVGHAEPPVRPARPAKPDILPPNRMPRRGIGAAAGKISLLHALAHIEFNFRLKPAKQTKAAKRPVQP